VLRLGGVVVERGAPVTAPAPTAPPATHAPSAPGTSAPGSPSASPSAPESVVVAGPAEAGALVGFPIVAPAALGQPAAVIVTDRRIVSLELPGGVRLDQFAGTLDPAFVKSVTDPAAVVHTEVGGEPALWLSGPHELVYLDRDGVRRTARTAAETLVWQRRGITLRLEGMPGLDAARAAAESVR
ncbi:MAG TPA: hypothetical protein VGD67_08835, partial [Pseudonocardiaceae bacterium]